MREFVTKHPTNGKMILIITGKVGYMLYPCTAVRKDLINEANGNNETDLDDALTCSMFGWDLPAAKRLSCKS